jgi:ring-1,2-phenylacetyl-CoA epoxidase subunit PaaE
LGDEQSYKRIRIKKIAELLKDFKVFSFESDEPIPYQAGQYITLVHLTSNGEVRRSYSMTSCPGIDADLSVGIKRIPNGFFSRLLIDHAKPGDELLTIGTGGRFLIPRDIESNTQIFFFAAGSGITPIYSLIKQCLFFHSLNVTLIYSNHTERKTIFKNELESLQANFENRFRVEWLFSNSANLESARLYRDLLIHIVMGVAPSTYKNALYYLCGPLAYMRMCSFVLHEMNVPTENIRKENFLIAQPPPVLSLPPDRDLHSAVIHFRGNTYSVPVHFPDSILQAAKKNGLLLPYSCETGRCANCVARRVAGKIWLSYNEVLTEKDMANGLTLTCVGHPVGGDVELSID